MLVGVRERGNDNFKVDFVALDSPFSGDKSLDVELVVSLRIGFDSFGGKGGRGLIIFSPFGDATRLIGFNRGRATEFIDSFTKSLTN